MIGAVSFLNNPVMGVGQYAAAALFFLLRQPFGQTLKTGVIAGAILMLVLTPWAVRNTETFGRFIPLRSNAGLELALSMHPAAVDPPADPLPDMERRLQQIHPTAPLNCQTGSNCSGGPYAAMQAAGGEAAYAAKLGRETFEWMKDNPQSVLRIIVRHLREIYLPPEWLFRAMSENPQGTGVRSAFASIIGVLGLSGLALAVLRRRPNWFLLAAMILLPGLLMSIFQPVTRYTYLLYAMLVFSASDLAASLMAVLRRRGPQDQPQKAVVLD